MAEDMVNTYIFNHTNDFVDLRKKLAGETAEFEEKNLFKRIIFSSMSSVSSHADTDWRQNERELL